MYLTVFSVVSTLLYAASNLAFTLAMVLFLQRLFSSLLRSVFEQLHLTLQHEVSSVTPCILGVLPSAVSPSSVLRFGFSSVS